jgi:hypothetical protein
LRGGHRTRRLSLPAFRRQQQRNDHGRRCGKTKNPASVSHVQHLSGRRILLRRR